MGALLAARRRADAAAGPGRGAWAARSRSSTSRIARLAPRWSCLAASICIGIDLRAVRCARGAVARRGAACAPEQRERGALDSAAVRRAAPAWFCLAAHGRLSTSSIWWSRRRSMICPRPPTSCTIRCRLHRVSAGAADASRRPSGQPRLAHLPRPFVTVLVGGSSGPYVFDEAAAARLGREASELAAQPRRQRAGLHQRPHRAGRGRCAVRRDRRSGLPASLGGRATARTPISAFLALADRIVVTADSISMIAEACATGKPVEMFDFGSGAVPMRDHAPRRSAAAPLPPRLRGWLYELYLRLPAGPPEPQPRSARSCIGRCCHGPRELARRRRPGRDHAARRRRDDAYAQPAARPAQLPGSGHRGGGARGRRRSRALAATA